MSSTKASLSDDDTVAQIFISLEAETTALLEPLDLSFFTDYFVFYPSSVANKDTQATRITERCPPLLLPRHLRTPSNGGRYGKSEDTKYTIFLS